VNAAAHEKSEVGTNSHHRILKGRMKNGHSANTRRRDSTMPQSGKDSIGIAGCGGSEPTDRQRHGSHRPLLDVMSGARRAALSEALRTEKESPVHRARRRTGQKPVGL
jgi:hypothetical protein